MKTRAEDAGIEILDIFHSMLRKQPMDEIREHKAYELLNGKFKEIAIDYVILSINTNYEGIDTHKQAVLEAFQILNRDRYDFQIVYETRRMEAVSCSMEELLQLPSDAYYDTRPKGNRAYSIPKPLPYWAAFLEPPHGVPYTKQDFIDFNRVLFPNIDECAAFRWGDAFSNYFDAGKEWWGTGLWTIFDNSSNTIVVIGASLTD